MTFSLVSVTFVTYTIGGILVKRTFFLTLLLLLLSIGGILLWQWNVYSENKKINESNAKYAVDEIIQINATGSQLKIKHEIANLPKGTYELIIQKAKKLTCSKQGDNCEKDGHNITKSDGGVLVLNYTVAKPKKAAFVLHNWAVKLKNVDVERSTVEITDTSKDSGVWASGGKRIGAKKKDLIKYYLFEGQDGSYPLYYQEKNIKHNVKGVFTVYGHLPKGLLKKVKAYHEGPLTIVFTNYPITFESKSLIVVPNQSKAIQAVRNQYVMEHYPFEKESEQWLGTYIAGQISNEKGEGKVKKMIAGIDKGLTEEEKTKFISLLENEEGATFTAKRLDQLLTEAVSHESKYFRSNRNQAKAYVSLQFMGTSTWMNIQGESSEIPFVRYQTKNYYPLKTIAENLNFKYEAISKEQIYLTNNSQSYRFFIGEKTFLYNEKVHSVSGQLLKRINDEVYVNEAYLLKVFNVMIRESSQGKQLISL